jgi:hypothetical protein
MIVVLRGEEGQIKQPHVDLEAWMARRPEPVGLIGPLKLCDQVGPSQLESGEQISQRAPVVTGLVGLAILQVGRLEREAAHGDVLDAGLPQRLEIPQMADVLLYRPAILYSRDQASRGEAPKPMFKARGSPSEPLDEPRSRGNGEVKGEAALEPRLSGNHGIPG